MTTLKLADGKVAVFTRLESPYWQVAFKLGDGTRIQKSLGTMDQAVARERAMAMYDEARFRERAGLSARAVSFTEAADARPAREPLLLCVREVEEPQGQESRAIGDPAQQLAPAAEAHFGELHFALDHGMRAADQRAHAGADDAIDRNAQFVEHVQDADVRRALRAAAAEHEADARAGFQRCLRGSALGSI